MNGHLRLYVDQYGSVIFARTVKELCQKAGYSKAKTMYRDRKGKPPVRVGYVVGPRWFDRFAPDQLPA